MVPQLFLLSPVIHSLKKIRDLYLARVRWRHHKIGKNFHAGRGVSLWAKHRIIIGDNFYIGKYSIIECDAEIGNNVIFANNVSLIGKYDHHYQQIGVPIRLATSIREKHYDWKGLKDKIIIEDDVWIGLGSIILSGVHIEQGSIIAAGSVVTTNVESFSIYAGIPAKKIRNRFKNEEDMKEHIRLYARNYKS
jgi:acetyltransferase-like isoleucine patch superfamily enzyme